MIEAITQPHYIERQPQAKRQDDFFYGSVIYLITEMGSLIHLQYDFKRKQVMRIQTSDFLKKLVCYKIKQITVTQSSATDDEDPIARLQMAMLIEHDCLCLVDLR